MCYTESSAVNENKVEPAQVQKQVRAGERGSVASPPLTVVTKPNSTQLFQQQVQQVEAANRKSSSGNSSRATSTLTDG